MFSIIGQVISIHKGRILYALVFSGVAVCSQMMCLYLIVDYLSYLLGEDTSALSNWVATTERSRFVWTFSLSVGGILAISSVFAYLAMSQSVKAMISHEKICLNRLLSRIHSAGYIPASSRSLADLTRIATKDIRLYGRLVSAVFEMSLPIVFLLLSLCVLSYIYPLTTLYVLVLLSSFSFLFYLRSRKVTELGLAIESTAKGDVMERKTAISHGLKSQRQRPHKNAFLESFKENKRIKAFLEAYGERLTVSYKALLISGAFLALSTFLVLLQFGMRSGGNALILSEALIYFFLLNFCLIQVKSISSSFVKTQIFLPFSLRFTQFMDSLSKNQSENTQAGITIGNVARIMGEEVHKKRYEAGDTFSVYLEQDLNKFTVGCICYRLGLSVSQDWVFVIYRERSFSTEELGDIRNWLYSDYGLKARDSEYSRLLLKKLHSADERELGSKLELSNLVLQACYSRLDGDGGIVFIDAKAFKKSSQTDQKIVDELTDNRIRVIVYKDLPQKLLFGSQDLFRISCSDSSSSAQEGLEEDLGS